MVTNWMNDRHRRSSLLRSEHYNHCCFAWCTSGVITDPAILEANVGLSVETWKFLVKDDSEFTEHAVSKNVVHKMSGLFSGTS